MKSWLSRWGGATRRGFAAESIAAMPIAAERLQSLRADDQFIISYPRSGNRWLRVMIRDLIVLNRPDLTPPAELRTLVADLHQCEPDPATLAAFGVKTRILKAHNLRALQGRRMVYLFRRAADALTSQYHFVLKHDSTAEQLNGVSINDFCLELLPHWVEHLELALAQQKASPAETCFIAYEALHSTPLESLRKAATFLRLPASDGVLAAAVAGNAFAKNQVTAGADATGPGAGPILRKGRVGTAEDELRADTIREIEAQASPLYERAFALTRTEPI